MPFAHKRRSHERSACGRGGAGSIARAVGLVRREEIHIRKSIGRNDGSGPEAVVVQLLEEHLADCDFVERSILVERVVEADNVVLDCEKKSRAACIRSSKRQACARDARKRVPARVATDAEYVWLTCEVPQSRNLTEDEDICPAERLDVPDSER